jgi:hypothetical protein
MRSLQRHEKVLLYHKVSKMMRDLGSHIYCNIGFQGLSHDARGEEPKGVKERAMPFLRCRVLQAMLANERGVYGFRV